MSDLNFRNKRVLLVVPKFGGFYLEIIERLKSKGVKEIYFIENKSNFLEITSTLGRFQLLRKLYYKLVCPPKRYMKKVIDSKQLDSPFDICICIQDHSLHPVFFEKVKNVNPNIHMILYLWDPMKMLSCLRFRDYFDRVFSFDKDDCHYYCLSYLPNFFILKDFGKVIAAPQIDLYFAGSYHTDRYKVLVDLSDNVKDKMSLYLKLLVIARQRLHSSFIYKICKTFSLFLDYIENYELIEKINVRDFVIYKPIPLGDLQQIMINSRCILDIHHPLQVGIPQQAMLALALGKKIVTTNKAIMDTPFYHPDLVYIMDRNNPDIPLDFIRKEYENEQIKQEVLNYELSSWLDKLLIME